MTKTGRPKKYTKQTFDKICYRIGQGESLRSVMKDKDMPNRDTFYQWLKEKELSDQYTHARQQQLDLYADEIIDIADNAGSTNEEINLARLKIETMKVDYNYGDKGLAINHNTLNIHEKYVLGQYDVKEIEDE